MNGTNKKLSLAICGLGRFARRRILPAIVECENVDLTAVVDRSGRAEDLPANTMRFASLDDLLAAAPSDAVYIASPNYLHAKHTLQALEAGLHVLCEKPMATTSFDCQSMLTAARDLNLHLSVGHMLRCSAVVRLARQWLQEGLVGRPRSIDTVFHYELPEVDRPWALRQDSAGGGSLMDAGIHCVDVLRFLVSEPVCVLSAKTDRRSHEGDIERSAVCSLAMGDVHGSIDVCSQSPYATMLTISGTEGKIVVANFAACWGTATAKLYPHHRDDPVREKVVDVSTTYAEQLRKFAATIDRPDGAPVQDVSAAENVRVVEQLYAISECSDSPMSMDRGTNR